ncbi:hypothetical protein BC826DRAFT_163575 [Russula brevipes]|nr:hypothetical protein BC826DRAFT_163575 [Russula brevipes]
MYCTRTTVAFSIGFASALASQPAEPWLQERRSQCHVRDANAPTHVVQPRQKPPAGRIRDIIFFLPGEPTAASCSQSGHCEFWDVSRSDIRIFISPKTIVALPIVQHYNTSKLSTVR